MKPTIDSLALFGVLPTSRQLLHVGLPNIGNRERFLERVGTLLDRKWLTNNGPYVQEFEARLCALTGATHGIATCNATCALEIAIRAAGVTGEVIVPSFTFVATAHALRWCGLTPVFCDIDPHTHNIDPSQAEQLITPRTTAILGVHLWGRPCDVRSLSAIARRHNLTLLFDAAHAFGCSYQGAMVGNFGAAEILSFHASKFINTFEGGAVLTNDDALAARVRLMRNFGFAGYDQVIELGINGKMSEVAAAMGLTALESLEEFRAVNHRNYLAYRRALAGVPGIALQLYDETERGNYQYIIIDVDAQLTGLSRDDLLRVLHAENVLARRYFYPGCHRMEPYRSSPTARTGALPHTESVAGRVLCLPTGTGVDPESIAGVCELIRFALAHGREIHERLRKEEPCVSRR